ncbi:hypothetical protein HG535_0H03210 [Zygotorulaspora mrakii]|uniref:Uncharacterized protein n=1 Tax=Zygotorulaspora mrakii TaxID=42260 RepID=A0A7H9B9L9_ZYGMR|nr:uncharacterized protein HG535_0H03210 [Zygotorulaspora mrakii]QLG74994.1 hypothetical protein HG535_0H03210 [Zygotorulaspora mrakii]
MPLFKMDYNPNVLETQLDTDADHSEKENKNLEDEQEERQISKVKGFGSGAEKHEDVTDTKATATSKVPDFKDYSVRDDDDDLTSSDEDGEREVTETSVKSWFGSHKHSRSNATTSSRIETTTSSASGASCASGISAGSIVAEGTPNGSKTGSSSRRSFRSFFRRDNEVACNSPTQGGESEQQEVDGDQVKHKGGESCVEKSSIVERDTDDSEKSLLLHTPTSQASSSKFWRGWKHAHRGAKAERNSSDVLNSNRDESLSKEHKREKNLIKLAAQLSDITIDEKANLKSGYRGNSVYSESQHSDEEEEVDSTSSSFERAHTLKERIDVVFSPSFEEKDEISPITPPAEVSNNPYKYVFEPSSLLGNHMVYDHAWLDKESVTFCNFDSALKLLTKDVKSLSSVSAGSNITISEISKEIVDFVRHIVDIQEENGKERQNLENELNISRFTLANLETEMEEKSKLNLTLNKQSDNLKSTICDLQKDLQFGRELNEELMEKLEETKSQKRNIKNHQKDTLKKHEVQVTKLNKQLESKERLLSELKTKNESTEAKAELLQKNLNEMLVKHEILQEKQGFTTLQLSTMLENEKTKKEVDERESVKNLELTSSMKNRYENTIGILKVGNLKIQENFHDERRKVLDLRRERKLLLKKLQLTDCHRAQSLIFMSHLMLYYRGIIPDQMLSDFDYHLKILNTPYFTSTIKLEDQALEAKLEDCQKQVITFYNVFARQTFLEQIVTKHVSYMRSNNFLSNQLTGLRKQIGDYEHYVDRLLKEIQEQKRI